MSLSSKVASALSFAHLAGLGRKPKAASDDKTDRDHEDGDVKKSKKAAADDPDEDDNQDKPAAEDDDVNAEGEDGPDHAAADGDDGDDEGDKKGKKAKSAEGDDDADEEMRGTSAAARARRREQARCAAIFASPAAARNPVLAANLAFKSRMSRAEALAILEATPGTPGALHPGRSAGNPRIGAGGDNTLSSKQSLDAGWDRAFAKVTPSRAAKR